MKYVPRQRLTRQRLLSSCARSISQTSLPKGTAALDCILQRDSLVASNQGLRSRTSCSGRLFLDDAVSSQLFAICCLVVTYSRVPSLILQSDGQEAPLSEKRTGVSPKARTYVKVSSSTLVRAPTHVGVHAGSYAARGRAHCGRCMAPQDHTA